MTDAEQMLVGLLVLLAALLWLACWVANERGKLAERIREQRNDAIDERNRLLAERDRRYYPVVRP